MDTKIRKQSEKLLFINWKLREQLHQAKEKIELLEETSKTFYSISFWVKENNGKVILFQSMTFPTILEAEKIFDFFKESIGFYLCGIEVQMLNERHHVIKSYIYPTIQESEVSNEG